MDALSHDVYQELRKVAQRALGRTPSKSTLSPTVLVHEVWLKLAKQSIEWENRSHFLSYAATAMRGILVDYLRTASRQKRAGDKLRVTFSEDLSVGKLEQDFDVLNQVLEELERSDPEKAKMVELRFFCGCSIEETAEVMGVSTATIKRRWRFTRAWLFARLNSH